MDRREMNARLHLGALATRWGGRPEIVRSWVAFYTQMVWRAPFLLFLTFLVAFLCPGVASFKTAPDFFPHMWEGVMTPADARPFWRFVLLAGLGCGYVPIMRRQAIGRTQVLAAVPWRHERLIVGMSMMVAVYVCVTAAIVAIIAPQYTLAAAGIVALTAAWIGTAFDPLAATWWSMPASFVIFVLVFKPGPLVSIAESHPTLAGSMGLLGALAFIARGYAPSTLRKTRVAAVDAEAVLDRMPRYLRKVLPEHLHPGSTETAAAERDGGAEPRPFQPGMRAWVDLSLTGRKGSLKTVVVSQCVVVVIMAIMGYLTSQYDVAFVMLFAFGGFQWPDWPSRLVPMTRLQRARWSFSAHGLQSLGRVALLGALVFWLVQWDPLSGGVGDGRAVSAAETALHAWAVLCFMQPFSLWMSTWIPRTESVRPFPSGTGVLTLSNPLGRYFTAQGLHYLGIFALMLPVLLLGRAITARLADPGVIALLIVLPLLTHYVCWRLVRHRYLRRDLVR